MPNHSPVVLCRNPACQHFDRPIRLPYPRPVETVLDRPALAMNVPETRFACLQCGNVSAYSEQDVSFPIYTTPAPSQPHSDQICVFVEFECGKDNCGVPAGFHVTIPIECREDTLRELIEKGFFEGSCPGGHKLPALARFEYQLLRVGGPIDR